MKTIIDYAELVKENHALNKTIASVETDETDASKAYQVGEQLIFNGILYDVIAPISQHDVITTTGSGANIAPAGSISAKIQALTNKLNGEIETRAKVSAHNFLIFDKSEVIARNTSGTWSSNVYTINGGTITLSDIGEIVVNGTFTAQTDFTYTKRTTSELVLTPGDYKLVGGISDNISVSGNTTRNGAYYNLGSDTGSELPFTITSDDAGVGIFVRVLAGTYNNVKVSPMITAPNDFASAFTPYAMTNRELSETYDDLIATSKLNLHRVGKVVNVSSVGNAVVSDLLSATVPEQYRPRVETSIFCYVIVSQNRYIGRITFAPNGAISTIIQINSDGTITTLSGSELIQINGTWLL